MLPLPAACLCLTRQLIFWSELNSGSCHELPMQQPNRNALPINVSDSRRLARHASGLEVSWQRQGSGPPVAQTVATATVTITIQHLVRRTSCLGGCVLLPSCAAASRAGPRSSAAPPLPPDPDHPLLCRICDLLCRICDKPVCMLQKVKPLIRIPRRQNRTLAIP